MFTWRFWRETIERSVKTGAQTVTVALGGSEVLNLFEMDFLLLVGAFGAGALLSVMTSLGTMRIGASNSPSAIE